MNGSSADAWDDASENLPALRTSFAGARIVPPRPKPSPPRRRSRRSIPALIFLLTLVALAAFATQSGLRRAAAAYWTGVASEEAIAKAVDVDPGNPVALRRQAFLSAQRSGDPGDAAPALRRAIAAAPLDLAPRLELASALQASAETAAAEAALLEAVELGLGYRARWSLTNFYLTEGRTDAFWQSARDTLLAHPEATASILGLCWRAFRDSKLILENAVPDSPEVYRRYFALLLERERLVALNELWPKLAPVMEQRDAPMASTFLELLIADGRVETAVEVWNRLCNSGFIPYEALRYPQGPYLTNNDFATTVSGVGFDWRIPPAEGVLRLQQPAETGAGGFEVRLSGEQASRTLLLTQVIPAPPPGEYTFRYVYQTQRMPRFTGLLWEVRDNATQRLVAQSPVILGSDDTWNMAELPVQAPRGVRLLRLELHYRQAEDYEILRGRFLIREAFFAAAQAEGAAE